MKISRGSDQLQHSVTQAVEEVLTDLGHGIHAVSAHGGNWVDIDHQVGTDIADRKARREIVCCWTGTGVAIAADKVAGVRAAVCADRMQAKQARLFNHANVLA